MIEISITTLMCVAPEVVDRAQRLEYAVGMIKRGIDEKEVRRRVQGHFLCSRVTAWRVVDMAKDVA